MVLGQMSQTEVKGFLKFCILPKFHPPHTRMKISLTHLPLNKQDQLKALTQIILDKVPAEMIILFGSYARGDWVED